MADRNPLQVLKDLFLTFRPKQWIKNGVLFAPLLFSRQFFNGQRLIETVQAFVLFCLLTGAVYVLNDIKDLKEDRRHPVKKNRPLASGRLSPTAAAVVACAFLITAFSLALVLSLPLTLVMGLYLLLQLGYTFFFKVIPYENGPDHVECSGHEKLS